MATKRKRIGRPPLAVGEGRTKVIQVRVRTTDWAAIKAAADDAGHSMSEWIRLTIAAVMDRGNRGR